MLSPEEQRHDDEVDARRRREIKIAFHLVEYEGAMWILRDHQWQEHKLKQGQDLQPADEFLYTLRLQRVGEDADGDEALLEKYVKDISQEVMDSILAQDMEIFVQEA